MFNHSSHVVILVSFLAGWLARKRRVVPENAHLSLNGFVIHLALPALILFQVPKFLKTQTLTPALVSLGLMPWVGFLLAWFILRLVSDRLGFSREARIAITVAVGLGNTAFVGFPILEALLGPDALPYGIILDQLGTFLVLTAVGVSYLAYHQEEARQNEAQLSDKKRIASVSWGSVLNRILKFTPFVALIAAFVFVWLDLPPIVQSALERLGNCLVPAALFSVGLQSRFDAAVFRKWGKELSFGLVLKLVIWPIVFGFVYRWVFPAGSLEYKTLVLQSGMASMITSMLLTIEAGFVPELCALFLSVGIPLSFLTTWLWSRVL